MAFKKKTENDGFDVLAEIKEPFSLANFYEDHIVGRVRAAKKFLEEKGILFFFLSPFQQRNRLILQLAIIVAGIFIGVIPRSMHLIDKAKERNAASEMAGMVEAGTEFTVGSLKVRPLASSQYGRQHLLAFLLTANGLLPSTPDRYQVELKAARGVMDEEHVSYSYEIVPVSEGQRLLLVYVDNRSQNDNTGIFHLFVSLVSDGLFEGDAEPMEVVLSDTQDTTELFDATGVDLSVLTDGVMGDNNTPVQDAREKLDEALLEYELECERIASLPLDMSASPTVSQLKEFVEDNKQYTALSDASTTADIETVPEIPQRELNTSFNYPAAVEMGGILYDEESAERKEEFTEEDETAYKELNALSPKVDNVLHALGALNSTLQAKYQKLKNYKLTLNQKVDVTKFTGTGRALPEKGAGGAQAEDGAGNAPAADSGEALPMADGAPEDAQAAEDVPEAE